MEQFYKHVMAGMMLPNKLLLIEEIMVHQLCLNIVIIKSDDDDDDDDNDNERKNYQ